MEKIYRDSWWNSQVDFGACVPTATPMSSPYAQAYYAFPGSENRTQRPSLLLSGISPSIVDKIFSDNGDNLIQPYMINAAAGETSQKNYMSNQNQLEPGLKKAGNSEIINVNPEKKPKVSYAGMICQAICSSNKGAMTLHEICQWIQDTYPYYKRTKKNWRNSIRHNLSLKGYFLKLDKSKGARWSINASGLDLFHSKNHISNETRCRMFELLNYSKLDTDKNIHSNYYKKLANKRIISDENSVQYQDQLASGETAYDHQNPGCNSYSLPTSGFDGMFKNHPKNLDII